MKKAEEKIMQSAGREKTTNPNPGKPQQPQREFIDKKGQTPEQPNNKKARPEEWQSTIPSEFQNKQQKPEVDLDDEDIDEENVEVLDEEEESEEEEESDDEESTV